MSTATGNPASAAATNPSYRIESPHKIRPPTTLNTSAPITLNLTTTVPPSLPRQMPQQSSGHTNSSMNETDRKIRRAERFWVPLYLSEEEKRYSRAQRFGTLLGPGATTLCEELKRKARSERFGQATNSTVDDVARKNSTIDDEAKKKARLARFGSIATTDTEEEEKKKARALRFAQSSANSQTKSGCKITKKAAGTGSKIGGT